MRNALLAATFLLGLASVGSAGPVVVDHYYTYHLEGVITSSGFAFPQEGGDLLAELIPAGSLFTIDVVVDTSAPGIFYNDKYRYSDAVVGLVFNLNGLVYTMTSPNTNQMGLGTTYTQTSISSDLSSAAFSGPAIGGAMPGSEFLFVADEITQTGSLFLFFLGATSHGNGDVHGTVTSVDVPEPATVLMLGGALALGGIGSSLRKLRAPR